jgi:hypothetical protein
LNQDAALIQQSRPTDIYFAITGLKFKSEIYYQLATNREDLLKSYADYTDGHRALQKQRDELQKDGTFPEGLSDDERAEYDRKWSEQVHAVEAKIEKFDSNLVNGSINQTLKEIERNMRADQSTDAAVDDLKEFLTQKSYGDYLIRMIKAGTSCDSLHEQYRQLAVQAKQKRNFQLATLSPFSMPGAWWKNTAVVNQSLRGFFSKAGYKKAAAEFDFQKHTHLAVAIYEGIVADLKVNLLDTQDDGPALNPKFSKMSADQLEAMSRKAIQKDLVDNHMQITKEIAQLLK